MSTYPSLQQQELYDYLARVFMSPARARLELEAAYDTTVPNFWCLDLAAANTAAAPYRYASYMVRPGLRLIQGGIAIKADFGFSAELGKLAQFTQPPARAPHAYMLSAPITCLLYQE